VDLSWHIINTLIDKEFDVVTCQEMLVDHACSLPLKLFYPEGNYPVTVVPVCINTVQFPLPKASRCYALGKAVGEAIQSGTATNAWPCWLGWPVAPAGWRARRIHQQGV
jgi:protocatechuate 4,5-dioxygenase beta chain